MIIKTPKLYLNPLFWHARNGSGCGWSFCREAIDKIFAIPADVYKIQFVGYPDDGPDRMSVIFQDTREVIVGKDRRLFTMLCMTNANVTLLTHGRPLWFVECHCWKKPTWKDRLTLGITHKAFLAKVLV